MEENILLKFHARRLKNPLCKPYPTGRVPILLSMDYLYWSYKYTNKSFFMFQNAGLTILSQALENETLWKHFDGLLPANLIMVNFPRCK